MINTVCLVGQPSCLPNILDHNIKERAIPGLTLPDQLFVPIMDIVCGYSGEQYTFFVLILDQCICIFMYRQMQTNVNIVKVSYCWYYKFCAIKSLPVTQTPCRNFLVVEYLYLYLYLYFYLYSYLYLNLYLYLYLYLSADALANNTLASLLTPES